MGRPGASSLSFSTEGREPLVATQTPLTLSECRQGDRVRVVRVAGAGALRKRLLEMGLVGGSEIAIVKYAPLRDPLELTLGAAHLSLRVAEAAQIEVSRVPGEPGDSDGP